MARLHLPKAHGLAPLSRRRWCDRRSVCRTRLPDVSGDRRRWHYPTADRRGKSTTECGLADCAYGGEDPQIAGWRLVQRKVTYFEAFLAFASRPDVSRRRCESVTATER